MSAFPCHHCGAALDIGDPIPRDAECPQCMGDVRCCLNCRHHDPSFHNQCRESEADTVEDRHRRNFCEFFTPSPAPFVAGGKAAGGGREAAARAKLDALFGGKPAAPDATTSAREKLEALFKKKPPAGD